MDVSATPGEAAEPREPEIHDRGRPRGASRTALIITAVVALAVGGAIGTVVGWKVEQSRVKADVKRIRPVGTITEVSEDPPTITLRSGGDSRVFQVSDATVIETADEGAIADVVEGAKVFVRPMPGRDDEAAEIVVLAETTTVGGG